MPIKRFADQLYKAGKLEEYMQLLVDNFNPSTVDALMCRTMISVSHDGSMCAASRRARRTKAGGRASLSRALAAAVAASAPGAAAAAAAAPPSAPRRKCNRP